MKAAVTGATGFVGSHLVEALRARGDQVTCLVRSPKKAKALEAAGVSLVYGDLEQERSVAVFVEGADVVFHLASLLGAPSEQEFLRVNRDGAGRLALAARVAGVQRFLHVSSLAVTGPTHPGFPLDESERPAPVTPYGRSKRAGEEAVKDSGVPATVVRPPIVYGPGDRELLRLFKMAKRGVAPLLGDGSQQLSLVHVRDLARALLAAASSQATQGGTYHASHPECLTQRQLLQAIGRAVGKRPLLLPVPPALVRAGLQLTGLAARWTGRASLLGPDKAPEFLAPAWICSSQALSRDTGWQAETAAEEGLRQTAEWYRAAGWL